MNKILIVDDERNIRETLRMVFSNTYEILEAESGAKALEELRHEPDLVILDIMMPEMDGLETLRKIREISTELPVIILTAVDRVTTVVAAMRLGAVDYLIKPFDHEEMQLLVRRMLDERDLRSEVRYLQTISKDYRNADFVGDGPAAKQLLQNAALVAKTPSSVLITGESGSGKEVLAKLIHHISPRHAAPFIAVHCAAVPESLFESELFGHEKGAFTDAVERKPGVFELARNGTLLLDEIGEMPAATQVKLLRVLQEREFTRLGGTTVIKTDVRVLAATSKDLDEEIAAGRFRRDLYYRLNVVSIHIPPLRERAEDIPPLTDHFFRLLRPILHAKTETLDPAVMRAFRNYPWPGNVRELKNVIERLLVLHGDKPVILPEHLAGSLPTESPEPTAATPDGLSLEEKVARYETTIIRNALKETGGVKSKAAKKLKTTRRILSYRMEKLGLLQEFPMDTNGPAGENHVKIPGKHPGDDGV